MKDAPQESLEWFDKAQATLEPLHRKDRDNVAVRTFLRNTHWNRASALHQLDRHALALPDWDRALALNASSKDAPLLLLYRAVALARTGQYDEATVVGEKWGERPEASKHEIDAAACIFSVASAAVRQDAKREATQREKLAGEYAARAIALLRRNQALGYFKDSANVDYVKKDRDFDTLRQHPDFLKLMDELANNRR